jgi:hypothetical protein
MCCECAGDGHSEYVFSTPPLTNVFSLANVQEMDTEESGIISVGKWKEGMTATLNLDIPWGSLQEVLLTCF